MRRLVLALLVVSSAAHAHAEVVTVGNPGDRMGRTSQLPPGELDALVAYLETL